MDQDPYIKCIYDSIAETVSVKLTEAIREDKNEPTDSEQQRDIRNLSMKIACETTSTKDQ